MSKPVSMARLSKRVTTRYSKDIYDKIESDAKKNDMRISEYIRKIVEDHYLKESADAGLEVVEDALKRVMNPYIDRLAELSAHSAVAAGMSAWLTRSLMKELTNVDTEDAWEKSYALSSVCLKRGTMNNSAGDN